MDHFLEASFQQRTDKRAWGEMEVLVEEVWDNQFVNGTKTVADSWFMMSSPWPVVGIASLYLYFVLDYGPKMMKSKEAFELKIPILAYNAAMVAFSSWWVWQVMSDYQLLGYFTKMVCHPSMTTNPYVDNKIANLSYMYLMSKYVELLDTVFFVLRRKQNQVTFLHVFHHTNMAVSTWFFVKYVYGTQLLVLGLVNSFVHVVMYTYYLLAGLGPQMQKYLWWKRYITRLQIAQFLLVIGYLIILLCFGCEVRRPFIIFAVFNTIAFLVLFMNFYINSYRASKKAKETKVKKAE